MKSKMKIDLPAAWIRGFCGRWKIKEFSIFGSAVSGEFGPESDVDVLLSFQDDAPWGLFEFVDMKEELEKFLGRRVDIVEKEGIRNPFRRNHILDNRKVIYAS